jgi:cytosine/adenosine deaminase-related metal-dependent hydrolase
MMKVPPKGIIERGRVRKFDGQGPMADEVQSRGGSWWLSPAFVNAHSHLEYRMMEGQAPGGSLAAFLKFMGKAKPMESPSLVLEACRLAAKENRRTGVWLLWEHSDRVGSRTAMNEQGLRGEVFQELITLFGDPDAETSASRARADLQDGILNPHALYTVHEEVIRTLSGREGPLSIHASESLEERELFTLGDGPFARRREELGIPVPAAGLSPILRLAELGFLGPRRQVVHACAVDDEDLKAMAAAGSPAAHCPRSNRFLSCPASPVRKMLELGIKVGLGMDSPASSGPIDVFAEMRAALASSEEAGEPLCAAQVWELACEGGAESLGYSEPAPWIGIRSEASSLEELIQSAGPRDVFWL